VEGLRGEKLPPARFRLEVSSEVLVKLLEQSLQRREFVIRPEHIEECLVCAGS